MAETVHQEPTTPAAEGQPTERTFTQAEMNAIISDRLNRERHAFVSPAAVHSCIFSRLLYNE